MNRETKTDEKVLCLPRDCLPETWLGEAVSIKMAEERFFETVEGFPLIWLPRHIVETDRAFKQLIPYVVLQCLSGLQTACYCRNGAESRLHSFWSVGIGGHINEEDQMAGPRLAEIVTRGMQRELREEFAALPGDLKPAFHGIINEEQTPVGHVHLGLVYRVLVTDTSGFRPGRELASFSWLSEEETLELPLELWSRLAIHLLESDQG